MVVRLLRYIPSLMRVGAGHSKTFIYSYNVRSTRFYSFYRSRNIAEELRHPCSSHHKANREANFGVRQCPRPPRPSPATHLQGRCLLYTRGSSICCGRTGYELGAGSYQQQQMLTRKKIVNIVILNSRLNFNSALVQ